MIPYHGTPFSGKADDVARFLVGRHALIPFLYQQHAGLVTEYCKSFILDNSAFSAWQQGIKIDFSKYVDWVFAHYKLPGFNYAFIPDNITGDEQANDKLLAFWPHELRHFGVPVWHLHESIERLKYLASEYRMVALGSSGIWKSPGSKIWWDRMEEILDAVTDENGAPPCKFHGLRMMNPKIFTKIPFAAVDSTNVGVNTGSVKRFGYSPPSALVRSLVLADRIESFNSPTHWRRKSWDL